MLVMTLALFACAQPAEQATDAEIAAEESAAATTDDSAMAARPGASGAAGTAVSAQDGRALRLEGLGELVIGQPVPLQSSFGERGAQIDETCRTVSSPDYPGVYAITEGQNGPLRRITIGQPSDVKLVEGIGVGATAQEVLAAFPGFRATPHKYAAAPAQYLTEPGDAPRLRFEIGENGRVNLIHAGLMPQLGYVEGCA